MKRRSTLLIALIAVSLVLVILVVSQKTGVNVPLLGDNKNASESDELVKNNGSAINGNQDNTIIPAISSSDQLLLGKKGAPLQMVVYEDLTNSYSFSYSETLKQVIQDFPGKLAIYVRPYFEADNTLGLVYQTAVACAGKEGKFSELRDFIFQQKPITSQALVDGAKKIGLNEATFSGCLSGPDVQSAIDQSVSRVRMKSVFGAPTSVLDGEIITGARAISDNTNGEDEDIEGLRSIINRHLLKK
ncbi:MAG: thioredoxin domain-containing protein [Patescibacteria group bacterium]|jgi:protein-disulfide isomerase